MLLGVFIDNISHQVANTFILSGHNIFQCFLRVKSFQVFDVLTEVEHSKGLLFEYRSGTLIDLPVEHTKIGVAHVIGELISDGSLVTGKHTVELLLKVVDT